MTPRGEILEPDGLLHLPVIVIGEYRYGMARSRHRGRLERLLELLVRESQVLSIDEETTHHHSKVREDLRRKGAPIPENDVWIAALARQHEERIVSRDLHFDSVDASLRVGW